MQFEPDNDGLFHQSYRVLDQSTKIIFVGICFHNSFCQQYSFHQTRDEYTPNPQTLAKP